MRCLSFLLLAAGIAVAVPASAHHGWGSYDANNPITIAGPIAQISLQNPHGEMTVVLQDKPWRITLAPPSRMNSRGATADIVKAGVGVVAYGYPKSDGSLEIRAEWVEVHGQRYALR